MRSTLLPAAGGIPGPRDGEVAGETEMVTPQQVIVDYMALLKVDGQWVIVNKIFERVPRP